MHALLILKSRNLRRSAMAMVAVGALLLVLLLPAPKTGAEPTVTDNVLNHCVAAVGKASSKAKAACYDNDKLLIKYARNAASYACDDKKGEKAITCVENHANGYIDDAITAAKKEDKHFSASQFNQALRQRLDREGVNYSEASDKLGAQEPDIGNTEPDCNGDSCDFIKKYVNPGINLLSISFGLIAVISIILGAIQYSASGGDPQQVTKAKQRISKTIFAIVAYFFLYAFLQFIVPGGIFK